MESQQTTTVQNPKEVRLVDIPITDETVALNVLISFLSLAQKKGAFTIDESAKIWECINKFNHH
jgi:glutathione synthase/RimK-type ligase-like ATP-grasp enzyme